MKAFKNIVFSILYYVVFIRLIETKILPNSHYDALLHEPKNVLLCSMMGGKSHIRLHFEIASELQKRGHHITYASSSDQINWVNPYNYSKVDLGLNPVSEELFREVITRLTANLLSLDTMLLFFHAAVELPYEAVYNGLKKEFERNRPDFVICDFLILACFDLANEMNITYAGSFPTLGFVDQTMASYITNRAELLPPAIDNLSFFERFKSFFITPLSKQVLHFALSFKLNAIREKVGVRPAYGNTWKKLDKSLIFIDSYFGFDVARPLPPLVHMIGPIVPETYPKLNLTYEEFLSSKSKVVYAAFGTQVFLNPLQIEAIFKGLILAYEDGLIDGIIWSIGITKYSDFPSTISVNGQTLSLRQVFEKLPILIVSNAPQISILRHPSTALFISHCGIESTFEGLTSGIPILAIPFISDQPANAGNIVYNGVGLALLPKKMTSESIYLSTQEIITDSLGKFKANVERLKRISYAASLNKFSTADTIERIMFLSALTPPGENPVAHLVTPDVDMNPIVAYNIDFYIIFGSISILIAYNVFKLVRFCFFKMLSFFFRGFSSSSSSHTSKAKEI